MSKKAIVIGAGQIGRGFMGERLAESGYDVVFLDVMEELIDLINERGEYSVLILGEEKEEKPIRNVRGVSSLSQGAAEEFLDACVVTTAVGPNIIPKIAPLIAKGIRLRKEAGRKEPLTVMACENMARGSTTLYEQVKKALTQEEIEYCETYVGFPDAEVSRIVVPTKCQAPLTVRVEKYMEWIVDKTKVKGDLRDIQGLELSDHVDAYVQRKIFTLTGHAMLGYMGYEKKHRYIWQAVYDPEIFKTVYKALEECGGAWSREYQMPAGEFLEYSAHMLVRFADQRVSDDCTRPAREPIRKLSLSERFFAPMLAAKKHGIQPENIARGIRSVLKYDWEQDQEAQRLQAMIKALGAAKALEQITGLPENDGLIKMIVQ